MTDIKAELLFNEIDPAELVALLPHFFSYQTSHLNEVLYHKDQNLDWALKLIYKKNELNRIERGPGLSDIDLQELKKEINSELVESTKQIIRREIFFSSYKVAEAYSVENLLQIYPVPNKAPIPDFLSDYPFVVEFTFNTSRLVWLRGKRQNLKTREILLLLNILIEGQTTYIGNSCRHHWVLSNDKHITDYCQEDYRIPGFVQDVDEFTDLTPYHRMREIVPTLYFTRQGREVSRTLEVSENFGDLLNRYHQLNFDVRNRFLRAAFWYWHAGDVVDKSSSAAFIALVTAIEVLISGENGSSYCCLNCRMEIGKSKTRRFIEFLEKYAPSDALRNEERKKLYRIRSDLSHGWDIFSLDEEFSIGLYPRKISERRDLSYAFLLTRIALVNWLISMSVNSEG